MMIGTMTAAITSHNIKLELDDTYQVSISENTSFTFNGLCGSLAVVYIYKDEDDESKAFVWCVSGMDLAMKLNAQSRAMFMAISKHEVDASDGRFDYYNDIVRQYPDGTPFLAGPHSDETALRYFSVLGEHSLKTSGGIGKGNADVTFYVNGKYWVENNEQSRFPPNSNDLPG